MDEEDKQDATTAAVTQEAGTVRATVIANSVLMTQESFVRGLEAELPEYTQQLVTDRCREVESRVESVFSALPAA